MRVKSWFLLHFMDFLMNLYPNFEKFSEIWCFSDIKFNFQGFHGNLKAYGLKFKVLLSFNASEKAHKIDLFTSLSSFTLSEPLKRTFLWNFLRIFMYQDEIAAKHFNKQKRGRFVTENAHFHPIAIRKQKENSAFIIENLWAPANTKKIHRNRALSSNIHLITISIFGSLMPCQSEIIQNKWKTNKTAAV